MTLKRIALVTVIACLLALNPVAAHAGEPNGSQGAWKRTWKTCANDGVHTTIGGQAWAKEFGKHRVRKFKVTYTVRAGSSTSWTNPVLRKKTYWSSQFPNDHRNFHYKFPWVKWNNLTAGVDGHYWLYATITWDRVGARDWKVKNFLLAVCS